MPIISQLFVYPVKSLRGIAISSAKLTPCGFEHDRQWMIINDNNTFVSQRKFSQMVLIHTRIDAHQLILSVPSQPSIEELVINIDHVPTGDAFAATIWKDTCQVVDEGDEASEWISRVLHSDLNHQALSKISTPGGVLRIVRMAPAQQRAQSKPELLGDNTHTLFADAAPFLMTSQASLQAVNQQLQKARLESVSIERFRPNIVMEGVAAFEEHKIHTLQHADYAFKHCYPCQRCVMPTVNIETGVRHSQQQPFSLVADINPMPDNAKAPAFGENAILLRGDQAVIRVGDQLDIE